MSDNAQIISSVVVDETGTVIAHDARPDNLADDKFWACTYRAVIKAACVVQERDSGWVNKEDVISDTDVARAQQFISAKFPGWKIEETDSDGETRVVELSSTLDLGFFSTSVIVLFLAASVVMTLLMGYCGRALVHF